MNTELYYFSGTGNSLYICKALKAHLESIHDESVSIIPVAILNDSKKVNSNADRIGIVYPTYDLDAPKIVKRFAKKLAVSGTPYVFLYISSGGVPGNSAYSIKKMLNKNNIAISNAFSAIYPDNSVVFPISAEENINKISFSKKQHKKDAETIYSLDTQLNNSLCNFSLKSYLTGKLYDIITLNYYGFKKIKASSACNSCGLCASVCPAKNIDIINGNPICKENCEMCFACIHICPMQALHYKRMPIRDNYQYRHPDITVKEILLKRS